MIYIISVELDTLMLHAKFQETWHFGSGEKYFLRFLQIIAMAAILVMLPGPIISNLFLLPKDATHSLASID